MKTIASPSILATTVAAIAMSTVSGLPLLSAQVKEAVSHQADKLLTLTKQTPPTVMETRQQFPSWPCAQRRHAWILESNLSVSALREYLRRVEEYAKLGQKPIPICFYPGEEKVPIQFQRFLVFNMDLISKQAKGRLPIYYLESIMGPEREERPFPYLACARGSEVYAQTSPLDQAIGNIIYSVYSNSRSAEAKTVSYKSEPRPPALPSCSLRITSQ